MEKACIFCGKILGRWDKRSLYCGNTNQTVCRECFKTYCGRTNVELGFLAYETGRAESAEELGEFVERMKAAREVGEEKKKKARETRITGKKCLRCGGEMLDYGDMKLKLGEETFFFSDWNRLLSGSLSVKVLRCEDCHKAEFYIPDEEADEA